MASSPSLGGAPSGLESVYKVGALLEHFRGSMLLNWCICEASGRSLAPPALRLFLPAAVLKAALQQHWVLPGC